MTPCAACGRSNATRPLYVVRGYPIVECTCGLARTQLPDDFDLSSIYTEEYFQGDLVDGYADYRGSEEVLRDEFGQVLAKLDKHVRGGSLIELGCAYGFLLLEAQKTFDDVCGIEISDCAREACIERGLDVVPEITDAFLQKHAPFSAAVLLDVIEHLQDPSGTLAMLHAHMEPGAQVVITTGDFKSMLARVMGKRWRLMTPPQHLWFFSRKTITAMLERNGFQVHSFEHPWKQVPMNLVAYQFTRYLGSQSMLKRIRIPGSVMLNLFDAMRVIATRR
jgi:2-polyprenyl-3-methyl-5-hydroxy-6-metoxy-1,4-benzoquinol methylase